MSLTPQAQAIWDQVPEEMRSKLLDSGFCAHCLTTRHFELTEGEIRDKDLVLVGKCGTCGHRVVRLIEI